MLGDTLRLLRKLNGIKANQLANSLQISSTYLSELEHNKKNPTLDLIKRYAEYFDLKPSTILFFDEKCENDSEIRKNIRHAMLKFLEAVERCEDRAYMEK